MFQRNFVVFSISIFILYVNVAIGDQEFVRKVKRGTKPEKTRKSDFAADGFVDAPKKMMDMMMKMMSFDMMMKPMMEMMQNGMANSGDGQQQHNTLLTPRPYGADYLRPDLVKPFYRPAVSQSLYPYSTHPYVSHGMSMSSSPIMQSYYGHPVQSHSIGYVPQYPHHYIGNTNNDLANGAHDGTNNDNNGVSNLMTRLPQIMMDMTLMPKMLEMVQNAIPSSSGKYSFSNK